MQPDEIQRRAAETILERGVRVRLPAPRFLRLLGKKEIAVTIGQPYLGTLEHLSMLSLKAGFSFEGIDTGDLDAAHRLIAAHSKTVRRILAVMILNSKLKIFLFSGVLASWLKWKVKPHRLLELFLVIVTLSGMEDFTNTIRLIRSMRVTMPRNLSPTGEGSHGAAL
ncbi:MAG TPA: hypothetical protein DCR40_18025 [Prolixibacteraceae bacterium]|nr:hypothetical protein [Prolixibacteraceae bacterium]